MEINKISLDPDSRIDRETIDIMGKAFEGVIENRVPIYFFDGTNTESGSSLNTTAAYLYLKERYEALGLTGEEIDELIRLDLADDE
ncbi:MAG: hypothetical protein Q4D04_11520, partial [Clostridia bacterium]|nr:hypothetical protein [Clostridia bacterium]